MRSSTGGVEDPAHFGALDSQFVVFSHGFLSLEDCDIDTFLLHKVQSGGGNLRGEDSPENTHMSSKTGALPALSVRKSTQAACNPKPSATSATLTLQRTTRTRQMTLERALPSELPV